MTRVDVIDFHEDKIKILGLNAIELLGLDTDSE